MQLIKTTKRARKAKHIGMALAAATCSLLNQTPRADTSGDPGTWRFDTAILYYGEDNGRVQATEPVISATRYFNNDKALNLKLVVDTLTGASPSGATPSVEAQTYTKPSGRGNYVIEATEDPLDETFRDTRVAVSAAWSAPFNRDWSYNSSIYSSSEHDYQSLRLSGGLSRYLNQKNTQLNLGLSFSADTIKPEGGVPQGLSRHALLEMEDYESAFAASRIDDSDTKSIADVLIGFSQVINKRTIMQLNYAFSQSDGYLTDPYKILSVIDENEGLNYGGNATDDDGLSLFVYEKRPDSRTKHALYWQLKTMLSNGHVIDGSYRFMTDDWGIDSHTVEFKYRWQMENGYLEPHIRYYMQGEADFYTRYLTASALQERLSSGEDASADYRLGEMTATTIGLKYAREVFGGHELSLRGEYYMQSSDGDQGIGQLTNLELYPDTNAIMFTIGYSF